MQKYEKNYLYIVKSIIKYNKRTIFIKLTDNFFSKYLNKNRVDYHYLLNR